MSAAPNTAGNQHPEFDSSAVEDLSAIMSEQDLTDLMHDLVTETETRVAFLESVEVADETLMDIQIRAHDLKSMSGNFGFQRLSDCARQVEGAAREGDLAATRALLPTLLARGKAALGFIHTRYGVREDVGANR